MARIIETKQKQTEKTKTEKTQITELPPTQYDNIKKELKSTETKKTALIEALEASLGVVSTAVKLVGIHRATFYEWIKNDAEFKQAVDDITESTLDFAETALHSKIRGGDTTAIIFYLKTKGKKRGYVEKSEVEFTQVGPDFSGLSTDEIINLLND
jgi:hypothetical protein